MLGREKREKNIGVAPVFHIIPIEPIEMTKSKSFLDNKFRADVERIGINLYRWSVPSLLASFYGSRETSFCFIFRLCVPWRWLSLLLPMEEGIWGIPLLTENRHYCPGQNYSFHSIVISFPPWWIVEQVILSWNETEIGIQSQTFSFRSPNTLDTIRKPMEIEWLGTQMKVPIVASLDLTNDTQQQPEEIPSPPTNLNFKF